MSGQLPHGAAADIARLAQQHGFATDAAVALLQAVARGGGSMAQFSHPGLGGSGQWMRGGMTMTGDFSMGGRVGALGDALAAWWQSQPADVRASLAPDPSGSAAWWPAELGSPDSSGGQDGARYAYFSGPRRLLVERAGRLVTYDTLEHRIGGVSQQQGGGHGLAFTSQHGTIDLASLPVVGGPAKAAPSAGPGPGPARTDLASASASPVPHDHDRVLATLEKLAELHKRGVLDAAEFAAKKTELLSRL